MSAQKNYTQPGTYTMPNSRRMELMQDYTSIIDKQRKKQTSPRTKSEITKKVN